MAAKTQQEKRRPQRMQDQHGRWWFATVEKASGYPTGRIKALFTAPIYPPPKYLKFPKDAPNTIQINYGRWIADLVTANKEWDENRVRLGRMISGEAFDPRKPATMELVTLLGPKPQPVEPVRACEQGNKWVLGLSDKKPKEAERFFPEPITQPSDLVFSDEPVFSDEDAPKAKGKQKVEA